MSAGGGREGQGEVMKRTLLSKPRAGKSVSVYMKESQKEFQRAACKIMACNMGTTSVFLVSSDRSWQV